MTRTSQPQDGAVVFIGCADIGLRERLSHALQDRLRANHLTVCLSRGEPPDASAPAGLDIAPPATEALGYIEKLVISRAMRVATDAAGAAPGSLQAAQLHLLRAMPATASPDMRQRDLQLRDQFARAGCDYSVLYGNDADALERAWQAISLRFPALQLTLTQPPVRARTLRAACDACSDPECEHRLFTGLSLVSVAPSRLA